MIACIIPQRRRALAALALLVGLPAAAPAPGPDGLVPVKAKGLDKSFVRPGTDFRPYTAVLLTPFDAAFAKNWLRDYNRDQRSLGGRVSEADAAKLLDATRAGAGDVFAKTFAKAGYRIADHPGAGVLRVTARVTDIRVTAPDTMSAGRTRTYSREAGSASLQVEAQDSVSGKLLGRAIDSRDIGDVGGRMTWQRNAVTNRADFERVFTVWANAGVKALTSLKASSAAAPHP